MPLQGKFTKTKKAILNQLPLSKVTFHVPSEVNEAGILQGFGNLRHRQLYFANFVYESIKLLKKERCTSAF